HGLSGLVLGQLRRFGNGIDQIFFVHLVCVLVILGGSGPPQDRSLSRGQYCRLAAATGRKQRPKATRVKQKSGPAPGFPLTRRHSSLTRHGHAQARAGLGPTRSGWDEKELRAERVGSSVR